MNHCQYQLIDYPARRELGAATSIWVRGVLDSEMTGGDDWPSEPNCSGERLERGLHYVHRQLGQPHGVATTQWVSAETQSASVHSNCGIFHLIMVTRPSEVFISYSHADIAWKNRLLLHLAPLIRDRTIQVWHDGMIAAGEKWASEIEQALSRASVAVLLATPDFLASPFITRKEIPDILTAAANRGLTILWISVKPCLYEETPLKRLPGHERSVATASGTHP